MSFAPEDVVLEPGRPDQAEAAAPLAWDTDPHLFDHFFRRDRALGLRFFARQWERPDTIFSFTNATVAVADDQLLGIEAGYDAERQRELDPGTGRCSREVLSPAAFSHFAAAARFSAYLMPPVPPGAYYVLLLAATPQARGRGIGARLLESAFGRARKKGYQSCHLDVYADNPAVRFYERMGLSVLSESLVRPLEEAGVGLHYRMVKTL